MSQKFDFAVGGQALVEGVMMRSKNYVAWACRDEKGEIQIKTFFYNTWIQKFTFLNLPIVRGFLNMIQMINLGSKALNYSIDIAFPEEASDSNQNTLLGTLFAIFNIVASFALAIFLFKFMPLLITTFLENYLPSLKTNYLLFNVTDSVFKIIIFLAYLLLISQIKQIKRLFMYHGAEHMAVFNYEAKEKLTIENTMKQPRLHPRCGTSFVLFVFVASIFVYMFIPKNPNFWLNLAYRVSFLPIIAGLSFEILKLAGKYSNNPILKLISMPGLALQRITTKQPTADQAEVAIAALQAFLGPSVDPLKRRL